MASVHIDQALFENAAAGRRYEMPPMHALEVFAMAARCGTFNHAAKQLRVTPSAVSRQVAMLEAHLGLTLFVRHKRGLSLTHEAEALLPVVEESFSRLLRMCESLSSTTQVLTLRMPPTFAMRWFLPRLPSLRTLMPDMDIRLSTDDSREPRFENGDVDAAIIYGRGDWPGVEAFHLMPERLTPVCSPELAKRLVEPADLKGLPLLQCYPIQAWNRWLEGAGVGWIKSRRSQTFDTLELALSAANRGQGVALGDFNLLTEALRDGVLVAPFQHVLDQGVSYFLIYPAQSSQLPKIRALRDWLTNPGTYTG